VDKKFYSFNEIPAIIAAAGGIGTYFSEVEGFGNNLLEMMSFGLPVVINRYDVYKEDIEPMGFKLPAIDNGQLTDGIVDEAYKMLCNCKYRNKLVKHNLEVLEEKLSHRIITEKMPPLIQNMFTKLLRAMDVSTV